VSLPGVIAPKALLDWLENGDVGELKYTRWLAEYLEEAAARVERFDRWLSATADAPHPAFLRDGALRAQRSADRLAVRLHEDFARGMR
jgi:hypothetical protein